ncbi:MAG TPA: hypothetical protein VK196_16800 [Magnetospirillum sp.]|nr:hypothetical protein [Magnetospirillum sp.]
MRTRSAALALVLAALAGGAHAERLQTGGLPVSNNLMIGTNVAAGMGNQAQQQIIAAQTGNPMGPQGFPLVSNNTQVSTNVAAGINNRASQSVVGLQGGGPMVGLDFSGRGPLVTTRVGVATNVAAGLNNRADQAILSQQR